MQLDIYERTVALEERRQEVGALKGEDKQESERLATEQGQLAELLMEVMPEDGEPPPRASSRELDNDLDRVLEKAGSPGLGADE